MMTTLGAIATAAEVRPLYLLELSHPSWSAPLRYALDTLAWTVTHEGGGCVLSAYLYQSCY